MSYATAIRLLGVTMLKGVDMSPQQFLLRDKICDKICDVGYIPACYFEEHVLMCRTNEKLAKLSASLTDAWKANIVPRSAMSHLARRTSCVLRSFQESNGVAQPAAPAAPARVYFTTTSWSSATAIALPITSSMTTCGKRSSYACHSKETACTCSTKRNMYTPLQG
ncbi:hypothetical protein MRX96_053739 [Rhipicephalus microplus]